MGGGRVESAKAVEGADAGPKAPAPTVASRANAGTDAWRRVLCRRLFTRSSRRRLHAAFRNLATVLGTLRLREHFRHSFQTKLSDEIIYRTFEKIIGLK